MKILLRVKFDFRCANCDYYSNDSSMITISENSFNHPAIITCPECGEEVIEIIGRNIKKEDNKE